MNVYGVVRKRVDFVKRVDELCEKVGCGVDIDSKDLEAMLIDPDFSTTPEVCNLVAIKGTSELAKTIIEKYVSKDEDILLSMLILSACIGNVETFSVIFKCTA